MEQNLGIAKKILNIVKVAIFMINRGISKKKIIMDLNMMMKRGNKLAGKAIHNLIFHHHHQGGATASHVGATPSHHQHATVNGGPQEYEFSCSSTPLYRQYFTKMKNHHNNKKNHQHNNQYDNNVDMEAVSKVLEMMASNSNSSPAYVLGFGASPMPERKLRITDSPYPTRNGDTDHEVDEQAEEFIKRFYSQLKEQKYYK